MRDLAFLALGMVIGGGLATVYWCERHARFIKRILAVGDRLSGIEGDMARAAERIVKERQT